MFDHDEFGWPTQRIWFGVAALLFTFFEAMIARNLPGELLMVIFGLAIGSLASAVLAVQAVRLRMQVALTRAVMAEVRGRRGP